MIETIEIENFKGTTASIDLKQLNIFRGLSGSGKSTWLEGIRVAVLGHDPGYGKLLSETMAFSSGESMEITVVNSGVYIKRAFSNTDGKASQKIFINGKGMTAKAAEPLLAEQFGQFPLMLNPGEFFGLSDEKKIEFLFGLSNAEADSAYLRRHCIISILKLYTEAVDYILEYEFEKADYFMMEEASFNRLVKLTIDKVAEKDVPAGRALTTIFNGTFVSVLPNGQETLSMYYDTLKTEINATQRTKRDAESANRKLMEERTEKLNLMEYKEEENVAQVEALRVEIADIDKELHSREKLSAARHVLSEGIKMHEAAVKQTGSEVAEIETGFFTEEEKAKVEKELKSVLKKHKTLENKIVKARAVYTKAMEKLKEANELEGATCPKCGTALSCTSCGFETDKQDGKIEEAKGDIHDLFVKENELRKKLEVVDTEVAEVLIRKEADDKLRSAFEVANLHLEELAGLLKTERESFKAMESPGAGTEALQTQIAALKKNLGERLVAQKNHDWLRTLSATIARANETINNSKSLSEALKSSLVAVKEIRDELTKSATSTIEEACNELLKKVDPSFNLTYSIADGKFGIRCIGVEGREVDFKTLSGGEQVLYLSAQLLALMTIVDPKLKILEVEMGELSGNLVPPFMDALEAMTEGKDIQVVLSSCHGDFEVNSDSWTVHQMGENE